MSNNQRHILETFFLIIRAPELGLSLCQWAEFTALFDVFSYQFQNSPKTEKITNGVIRGALHRLREGDLFFRNITSFQDSA
jgi:hypothetical protein